MGLVHAGLLTHYTGMCGGTMGREEKEEGIRKKKETKKKKEGIRSEEEKVEEK